MALEHSTCHSWVLPEVGDLILLDPWKWWIYAGSEAHVITDLPSLFSCWLLAKQPPEHECISPLELCFLSSWLPSKALAARYHLCCQAKPCHAVWWDRLLSAQPEMGLFSLSYWASLQTHWLCQPPSYTAFCTGSYFPSRTTSPFHPLSPYKKRQTHFCPILPFQKAVSGLLMPYRETWPLEEPGCWVNNLAQPNVEQIWLVWPLADSPEDISPSLLCAPAKWALLHCVPDLSWH